MRFQHKVKLVTLLTYFCLAVSTLAHAILWEDTWQRNDVDIEGFCAPPPGIPPDQWECKAGYQPMTCDNLPNRYRTIRNAAICTQHPSSCVDTDSIKKTLYFHGEDRILNQSTNGQGFPMISKDKFTKSNYISVETRVKAYCGPAQTSGCYLGLTLYNGESNYRAIAYIASPGSSAMEVHRYEGGRCLPGALESPVSVVQGTYHILRLDYYGHEGGKWVYFVDNIVREIEEANANNKGSVLQDHPRVGLFFAGMRDGSYVEGDMGPLRVWTRNYEDARQASQADGFATTSTRAFVQEVYMGDATQNITKVRLFLVHGHEYMIAAYTDALGGKPGTLINETFYTADRHGFQDVPLWVSKRYAKIWIRIAPDDSPLAEFGTSAPGTNPYPGRLMYSDNNGRSWTSVNRDMSFITYERR